MRRAHGYATISGPDQVVERDSITCCHCQRIVFVKPGSAATVYLVDGPQGRWEEPGAMCQMCMQPVCLRCHDIGTCTPFERKLERMERRGHQMIVE